MWVAPKVRPVASAVGYPVRGASLATPGDTGCLLEPTAPLAVSSGGCGRETSRCPAGTSLGWGAGRRNSLTVPWFAVATSLEIFLPQAQKLSVAELL